MNYPLKSKPKRGNGRQIILVTVLFLIISATLFLFPNAIRSMSYGIARPFWVVGDVVSKPFTQVHDFFTFKSSLVAENNSIKDELSRLKLKEIDYDAILQENQTLKESLGRTTSGTRVLARILSKPPQSPYDTFVIDAGSSEGLTPGNKVYLSDTTIIGLVTNVTTHTSLVELFSSGNKTLQTSNSRTGATFSITGIGGANMKIEVPKDTDILWGDVFIYPGLSTSVIGSVYYIDTNSQSSFKTAYIRMPGNVFSSQSVFVEKSL